MILDDPIYTNDSFNGFVTKETNFLTWFLESSTEPIMGDCPVSRGRVLSGIAHACRALVAHLSLHMDTVQARVRDLKGATTAKEGYIQEDIVGH